ncbi:gluconate 2-dehydrogenase subunit 3 family protein [Biostraticola tofi]|uniref:Gluconate 2-dehydrogenase gamma chain n=1 Tax=Biostraticola tofi TaxID=466109 RepID=A0A4R3Z539_9GAMM|nr:gluconate 2-dehydrogenase subunit 3 family protein [Biostraticola tofi]TCW00179.1 gluconate 2-dehydrogenase gamma chain [Biostraticola tofi]
MPKRKKTLPGVTRRQLLTFSAASLAIGGTAKAATLTGTPGWQPFAHNPTATYENTGWQFFTDSEVATLEAMVERLLPADEFSVSGKDAGCVVFIDRQMKSFYGNFDRLYMQGPFLVGTPEQGDQSPLVPTQRYRLGLASLEKYCQQTHQKAFNQLTTDQQDQILTGLDKGDITLADIDAQLFMTQVLNNTMEGFFADPMYGGNRDMASWKMIGFPGARYDYRDMIEQHNQDLHLTPVSIRGSEQWNTKG